MNEIDARVKVMFRFRPPNDRERSSSSNKQCVSFPSAAECSITSPAGRKSFAYDRVFPPDAEQEHVFDVTGRPIVERVLEGYHGTALAYGQTGSGKTFTMMGPDGGKKEVLESGSSLYAHRGIIPRIVELLFTRLREREDAGVQWKCTVSFLELYMERFGDLLSGVTGLKDDPAAPHHGGGGDIRIREDLLEGKGIYVENCREIFVENKEDVYEVLSRGLERRHTAATGANDTSSRSHTIFTISLVQIDNMHGGGRLRSKLNLVDLAGSEKVAKTHAAGQRLEEAKKINLSLTLLGNVINRLTDGKSSHVPYRDSKLTRLLQDSFGGNSLTTLLCNGSPSSFNLSETISTLLFASRAKRIKNAAKINKDLSTAELKAALAKAHEEIRLLKIRIAALERGEGGINNSDLGSTMRSGTLTATSGIGNPAAAGTGALDDSSASARGADDDRSNDLARELDSLRDDIAQRIDEIAELQQEKKFFEGRADSEKKKYESMESRWKEEARMCKYWVGKYQEVKKQLAVSSSGASPAVKPKKKPLRRKKKKPASTPGSSVGGADGDNDEDEDGNEEENEVDGIAEGVSNASINETADNDNAEMIVTLRDQIDTARNDEARWKGLVSEYQDTLRETDDVLSLLRTAHDESQEECEALRERVRADAAKIAETKEVSSKAQAEVLHLRKLLEDNNIQYTGQIEQEKLNRARIESELQLTSEERARLAKESEQRTLLDVIAIDIDVQAKDMRAVENDVYLCSNTAFGDDDERAKFIKRTSANLDALVDHLSELRSMASSQFSNVQDAERAIGVVERIDALQEEAQALRLGIF